VKLRGRVEIRDELGRDVPSPRYSVSWQRKPNDADAPIVDAAFEELPDAIEWARARARQVFVDLEDEPSNRVRYFLGNRRSYGEPWPEDLPVAPKPVEGHGGDAHVRDEAHWTNRGFLSVHWDGGQQLERKHHGYDLEAAIDWGRARAKVVVVEILPETYTSPPPPKATRHSAGIQDPPGEALLRLRPREGKQSMKWHARFRDEAEYVVDAETRRDAVTKATERYIREVLKPEEGSFVVIGPEIRPLDE
jgi:hypothetical protein